MEPAGAPAAEFMPIVYDELHRIAEKHMAGERPGHTLQPTAVVHEAFLRLARRGGVKCLSQTHFFALAASTIRRVLVDHARRRLASKRGGTATRTQVEIDEIDSIPSERLVVLALDEALQQLANLSERQVRVVELRYFAGLGVAETAAVLDVSKRTVKSDWRVARAWLATKLNSDRSQ